MARKQALNPGQLGTCNGGFPAKVIRMYSQGMVEVRLLNSNGLICIPVEDFEPSCASTKQP